MAEACYDSPEDAVVVFASNVNQFEDFKPDGRRLIVYQLEQLCEYGSLWLNPKSPYQYVRERTQNVINWLKNADEIWDYDLDNIAFLEKLGFKNLHYKPMQYCEELRYKGPQVPKEYDLLFFGSLNKRRVMLLRYVRQQLPKAVIKIIGIPIDINPKWYGLKVAPPIHQHELEQEIRKARAVLNLHYYDQGLQEQVRLFPLLINNIPVLSEKSRRNYFGDLITEFTSDLTSKYHQMNRNPTADRFKSRCLQIA